MNLLPVYIDLNHPYYENYVYIQDANGEKETFTIDSKLHQKILNLAGRRISCNRLFQFGKLSINRNDNAEKSEYPIRITLSIP